MPRAPLRNLDANAVDSSPPLKRVKVDDTSDKDIAPGRRRRQNGKTSATQETGKLAFILEAPTEIAVEILSLLEPLDLLNLSMVNKDFRSMLTSPSANIIWLSARRNVALPDELPPDFTEPAFARFLYVPTCQLCDGPAKGMTDMIYHRVRLCKGCLDSQTYNGEEAAAELKKVYLPLTLIAGFDIHTTRAESSSSKRNRYLRRNVEAFIKAVRKVRGRSAKQEWVESREQHMERVRASREPLLQWIKQTKREKKDDRAGISQERVRNICARLIELGHDATEVNSIEFTTHAIISKAEKLTDDMWAAQRPKFERTLAKVTEDRKHMRNRIHNEPVLRQIFTELWNALPTEEEKYSFLPVKDFLELQFVSEVAETTDNVNDVRTRFEAVRERIDHEVGHFCWSMRRDLVETLLSDCWTQEPPPPECYMFEDSDYIRFLKRAISAWIAWTGDMKLRSYGTMWKDGFFGPNDSVDPEEGDHRQPELPLYWQQYLQHIQGMWDPMTRIIREAGLSEKTARFEELEEQEPDWRNKLKQNEIPVHNLLFMMAHA